MPKRFTSIANSDRPRRLARRAATSQLLLVLLLLLVPVLSGPRLTPPALAQTAGAGGQAATALEQPLLSPAGAVIGRHYLQTGDGATVGFDVNAPFYQRLVELGGPTVAGYPVSIPFEGTDGCTYQAFQVFLLQQCGDGGVRLANTFELLQDAGVDAELERIGVGRSDTDTSTSFEEALRSRQTWLEDAAIRDRFIGQCGDGDFGVAVDTCGLPMNRPRQFGAFVSQRFQRVAFQRWLVDGPSGIRTGDVTPILGGDLLKDTGVLSGVAVRPHVAGRTAAAPLIRLTFGTGTGPANVPALAAPGAPATTPARRTIPLGYGFQADFHTAARRKQGIPLVTGAGFGWVKQQLVWANFEMTADECRKQGSTCLQATVNGSTKYFWRNQLDDLASLLDEVRASGLHVMVSVVRAPAFYAAPQGVAPADPNKLRDFLQYLVTYPSIKGKIEAIEPWNEQNLSWEWGGARLWPNAPAAPPQGAVDFVQLQKAAFQGIKAGDGQVVVVLPALTPTGVGECWRNPDARGQQFCLDAVRLAIDDVLYLEFLFGVNGAEIKNYYDVLGVHPSGYNNPPDDFVDRNTLAPSNPAFGRYKGHGSFYIKRYQQLREVQERFGDTKPMWLTEVGWSSTRRSVPGYEFGQDNTEEQRGRYVARMLEQINAEAPYITHVFLWNLNFRTFHPDSDERFGFGVVDPSGAPLPAYTCAADYVKNGGRITRPDCLL